MDVTPLFKKSKIKIKSAKITETIGMYPYKEKVEDNWAYFTSISLKRLKEVFKKENKKIETAAIVGIGSGIEAIALIKIFKNNLKRLIITDVDQKILNGAVKNINSIMKDGDIEISIDEDDKKISEFINEVLKQWDDVKEEFLAVVKKIKESWLKETDIKEELGYLG